MADTPDWHIVGDWFDNCSCDIACPCTFAQAPDNGWCEGGAAVARHARAVRRHRPRRPGLRAGRALGGRPLGRQGERQGRRVHRRARRRRAGRGAGGDHRRPRRRLHGQGGRDVRRRPRGRRRVERAKISFEIAPDQSRWGVDIGDRVTAWAEALTGPTSNPGEYPRMANAPGSETGPGPQLVTWGEVDRLPGGRLRLPIFLGRQLRQAHPVRLDRAVGPFKAGSRRRLRPAPRRTPGRASPAGRAISRPPPGRSGRRSRPGS